MVAHTHNPNTRLRHQDHKCDQTRQQKVQIQSASKLKQKLQRHKTIHSVLTIVYVNVQEEASKSPSF